MELRRRAAARPGRARSPIRRGLTARLLAALPFRLTGAQRRVLDEVERDLCAATPMARLVQGDVGCGKTVIAAAAAARAIGSGAQVAFMAPTELLAEQHARSLMRWFDPLGVTVSLLTGSQPARARARARCRPPPAAARACASARMRCSSRDVRFEQPGAGDHR